MVGMKYQDACIIATVCGVTVLSVRRVLSEHTPFTDPRPQLFLTGATNVSITTIGRDLRFKQSDMQWPLNVFS